LRHLRGAVIVLLDNSSTHQGLPLQQLLRQHPHSSIVAPMIWKSWSRTSSTRSMGFVTQLTSCAGASCNPNCPLFCVNLLHS
jgi:hypothetical protein